MYSEDSNLPVASYENVATHFESTLDSRLSEDLDVSTIHYYIIFLSLLFEGALQKLKLVYV